MAYDWLTILSTGGCHPSRFIKYESQRFMSWVIRARMLQKWEIWQQYAVRHQWDNYLSKKLAFLDFQQAAYEIHIFKGDIIITCRLVVMDMFFIQMTTVFSLPVMEGQEKLEFSFHNAWCFQEKPGSMISGSFQWTNGHGAERMTVNKSHCSWTNAIFSCYTKKTEQGMISASFPSGKHKFKLQQKLENLQHCVDSFTN